MYFPVKVKFFSALLIASAWALFSTYLAMPWIKDLTQYIGPFMAWLVIFFIALLPGFMSAFMLSAFLLDKRPVKKTIDAWPSISILVPAHNEEDRIQETLQSLARLNYPRSYEIIAIDNNSTDETFNILNRFNADNLIVLQEEGKGKSYALNKGLSVAKYELILTIDADTYLLSNALTEIVTSLLNAPSNTAAVAGSIYVKNSRKNFMTRIQEWDYFHAIASVKRVQSLFQGTLVAQGAFSIYKKSCLLELGGWAHLIGEDIVLTWGLIEKGYRIDFSEDAIAFTNVPETYRVFFNQRSRWARGLLEAFAKHPKVLIQPRLITFLIYWNLLFPAIDIGLIFIVLPGIIAAFFGYFFIAGPLTLAVLPLSLLMNVILLYKQRHMFTKNRLMVRSNYLGLIYYALFYNLMMSPASIYGYLSEIFNTKKKWGTK